MDPADETPASDASADDAAPAAPRRRWRWVLWALAGLLVLGLAALWWQRENLADRVIAAQLEKLKLEARYKVEKIGTRYQVLTDVSIGDPARPDFTAERVEIETALTLGVPALRAIKLVKPRLYGSYKGGKLSFGALDKVLFTGSKEPFRLPDLVVELVDGRARMDSDYGPVGIKLDGRGALRAGFSGTLAAVAPSLELPGCAARGASLYGKLRVETERPLFTGPLRLARLTCPGQGLALADAAMALGLKLDKVLTGGEGTASFTTGALAVSGQTVRGSAGETEFAYREGDLTLDYDLTGRGANLAGVALGRVELDGALRSSDKFARIESEGQLAAREVRLGNGIDSALASAARSAEGSLAAPMLAQIRGALARQLPGSSIEALYTLRQTGGVTNLLVPRGGLRGGGGAPLLTLSRFELTTTPNAAPRFAGNFITGGAGMPQLSGQFARQPGGGMLGRMRMAEYRAGNGRLALPELVVVQSPGGGIGFSGTALLSGPLPGGMARGLVLPLDGNWSPGGGLAAGRKCLDLRYEALGYANLVLTNKRLLVCPGPGGAILRADGSGVKLAAGAPSLNVSGRLGSTPIRIASGPVGFAMPGQLAARSLKISLGPAGRSTDLRISNLNARVSAAEIAGRFADTEARLDAVPLDILAASGGWRYANGSLTLSDGAFRLEDRQIDDRFKPLIARDATLTLANNQITAAALLREPASDRAVSTVDIRHSLGSGIGHADLRVDGLVFDRGLQPDTLSNLALGVIANARGTLNGTGRIDWNPNTVTSTGRFSTDRMDFAAAFGPVEGASGTVVFTDLIGLVTAPNQSLKVASINPGIEVNDGTVRFQLERDGLLKVLGAEWPFMDGELFLEPTTMVLGAAEVRRFRLTIRGLNSARFVERLELGNLSASGIFDGELPLVFDENGGKIVGGKLVSRAPGGNVSYVGELTYRDLSAMGNFAFEALRSLDYKVMTIGMDGELDGEVFAQVKFDGVSQGKGAKRNIITRRLAGLPIQFNVNLRASFITLITSLRSLYDESYIPDPRDIGLIGPDGKPATPPPVPTDPALPPPDIQPPVSRNKR